MYTIDKEDRRPAYMILYELLKADIVTGVYPPGSRLPSKRALADDAGVSVVTAQHALDLLTQEGYAEARERSGCFASLFPDRGFEGAGHREEAVKDIAPPDRAAPGQPPLFPVSVLLRHMRRTLSEYHDRLLVRSPHAGLPELTQALSAYLRRSRHMAVEPSQIVVGAGAEYLYGLLVILLGRDRVWGVETPSYEKITRVYQANGVRLEMLPLGQDGILSEALRASRADILHITPYRSFPSGVTASASRRHEYLTWAAEGDRLIIEDDYSSEFSVSQKPEDTVWSLSGDGRVIYLNTFTLTVAPSVRIGYMVLPRVLLSLWREKAGFYACSVPVFDQLVLAGLLDSGDFERHIRRVRRILRNNVTKFT